jgi:hypothetical protein
LVLLGEGEREGLDVLGRDLLGKFDPKELDLDHHAQVLHLPWPRFAATE